MASLPVAVAPLFAITAALASLACCLPFGIAGALGAVGLSFYLESKRGWVLGVAALFLALTVFQLYRQRKVQGHINPLNVVLLSASAALVAVITIFPDNIALFFAQFNR
jgi:hypothetical protein